jgi:hypothetical protein
MPHLRCEHTIRKTRRDVTVHKVLTTIGRAPGNDVVLDDPMLQPTHANLMRQGTTFTLSVLAKDGDAYVNGRRVRTATLAEGDRILLGAWQLVWSERDAERAETQVGGPTQTLDLLEALVSLSADMMKDTSPERLFSAMLEKLVELTRAEKGFVVVMQDGERHLAASHNTGDQKLDISRISDSIVQQVCDSLQPIIVSDATTDSRFAKAKSVVDLRLSSVMCVPLIYRKRPARRDLPRQRRSHRPVHRARSVAAQGLRGAGVPDGVPRAAAQPAPGRQQEPPVAAAGRLPGRDDRHLRAHEGVFRSSAGSPDGPVGPRARRDGHGQGARRPRAPPALGPPRQGPSSPSTAAPSPRTSSRASCSGTARARSPAP